MLKSLELKSLGTPEAALALAVEPPQPEWARGSMPTAQEASEPKEPGRRGERKVAPAQASELPEQNSEPTAG